jgi:CHAD domain-containing protein
MTAGLQHGESGNFSRWCQQFLAETANGTWPAAIKKMGRALGKVRDVDVQIALIRDLEVHAPETAHRWSSFDRITNGAA